jgi:hypothetical protein
VACDVPEQTISRLQAVYRRLEVDSEAPFRAGLLVQSRVEAVLGNRLEYSIPLPLSEVIEADSQFEVQQVQCNRPFAEDSLPEFRKHVQSGALVPVPDHELESTLFLPLFAIQQEAKCRLIFDARLLNAALSDPSFAMETIFDLPCLAEGMQFVGKLDLMQAYCQYPVAADLSAQLGCRGPDNKAFRWSVLPFGLSHSPRVFCSVTSAFIRKWRGLGVRCMAYVDDIIFFAASMDEFARAAEMILTDLRQAGLLASPKKTFILPFTMLDVLGLRINLISQSLSIPPSKINKIAAAAHALLSNKQGSRRTILSLIGRLGHASAACPYISFFRAALLGSLQTDSLSLTETIFFSTDALRELQFWASEDARLMLGTQWPWKKFCSHRVFARHSAPRSLPSFTVWGDASEFGAGYNSSCALGLPESELLPPEFSGNHVPSIVRELWVIVRLVELAQVPNGSCLRLISDNQGAVATANGSAVCASTAPLAQRLVRALTARNIYLQVEWASRDLLDDVDQRSRWDAHDLGHAMCTQDDYSAIFSWAFGQSQRPSIQLFSCAGSAIPGTPQCTRFPEPGSIGCPFMLKWAQAGHIWAFPPFSIVRPFLKRLLVEAHRSALSICALLPRNASSIAAISALPRNWRVCPGPRHILAPPHFSARVPSPVDLVLVASPIRPWVTGPRVPLQPARASLWNGQSS